MRPTRLRLPSLLALAALVASGQPQKPAPKPQTVASGVFLGRSGKPMAKARLMLAQVSGDQEVLYATLKLLPGSATTDEQGRFEFRGFTPGLYTIVYMPAGSPSIVPTAINIKAFLAVTKSPMPLLRGAELGRSEVYPDRTWARQFTLLKGHTFLNEGEYMKIWNATIRHGQQGPYMEVRKGIIWQQRIDDKSQIKFDAWSY